MSHATYDLDHIFKYHQPQEGDPARYEAIREAGKHLAQAILDNAPAGADQTTAIRKIREAVMTANAAIALRGRLLRGINQGVQD